MGAGERAAKTDKGGRGGGGGRWRNLISPGQRRRAASFSVSPNVVTSKTTTTTTTIVRLTATRQRRRRVRRDRNNPNGNPVLVPLARDGDPAGFDRESPWNGRAFGRPTKRTTTTFPGSFCDVSGSFYLADELFIFPPRRVALIQSTGFTCSGKYVHILYTYDSSRTTSSSRAYRRWISWRPRRLTSTLDTTR